MDQADYAVLLSATELPSFMVVAQALARALKTPVLDQTVGAKRAWGIVAQHQSIEGAEALQATLARGGLPCFVAPMEEIPTLPKPLLIMQLDRIDSERLVLIGAAAISETTVTTVKKKEGPTAGQQILNAAVLMSTGLPLHLGGKKRVVEKTTAHTDRLFYMDLILKNPWARWRIDAQHFDYSCLGAQKTVQGFGNFRLLVSDLIRKSGALYNHGARVLDSQRPVLDMEYHSLADLDREMRWMLTPRPSA